MTGPLEFHGSPPPPTRGGRGQGTRLLAVTQSLRDNPGQWAVVHTAKAGAGGPYTSQVNRGQGSWGPKGDFEAVSRLRVAPDGKVVDTWARYVGGAS